MTKGRPRFTQHQAILIRREYAQGARYVEIEARWGVARGTLSSIIRGTYWSLSGFTNISRGRGRRE